MINRALIVDVETSGLSPETDRCTEVAAILYSLGGRSSLVEFSMLTGHASEDVIVQALTGITKALAYEAKAIMLGRDDLIGALLRDLAKFADCVVAHNAEFDRQWLEAETGVLPWLCTMNNFRFPGTAPGQSLTSLALAMGVPVVSAHRALTDCRLIASIFSRCAELGCDLQELFQIAQRPKALFVAVDSGNFFRLPEGERNAMIAARKAAGFKWNRLVQGAWARRMPAEDTKGLPFEVREVG